MSEPVWRAETRVDEATAAELIRAQLAPLPRRSVELVSEGWDYVVHRVDEEWAFRFPRRGAVVPGTEREIDVLPRLAPLLPVAVPVPVHVGRPAETFPWPFYGAAYLRGVEPDASLPDDARARLARPLARFLRALHAPETLAAVGDRLPVDPNRRADTAVRAPVARDALAAVADLWQAPPQVEALLAEAAALPPPEPAAVCHGDLHFRQLLVADGALTGIVDWVDLCRADPGIDLALAWSFLAPPARAAFLDEYGPVGEASVLRARVLALNLSAILLRYARDEGLPAMEAEARAGLDRAVV